MEEKLKELLSNEEYVKELVALREPAKIRENLLAHDVDLSENEIEKIITLMKKKANGELTDEELSEVAGGSFIFTGIVVGIFLGSFTGAIIAKEAC